MTKKDYKLLAEVVAKVADGNGHIWRYDLLDKLEEALKKDNPRFDGEKFRKACYEE